MKVRTVTIHYHLKQAKKQVSLIWNVTLFVNELKYNIYEGSRSDKHDNLVSSCVKQSVMHAIILERLENVWFCNVAVHNIDLALYSNRKR